MKNKMGSACLNKLNSLLTHNLSKFELLSLNDIKKVRGGDAEGNGGGDIIIIPKPK